MQNNNVSDTHFNGTTGYGYDDKGRDGLDCVYRDVFKAEDALVRHQIVSGTHALALCLFGNLRPGDELLSVVGKPYDTLEEVIGIRGEGGGSLKEFGVSYNQVNLLEDGSLDYKSIEKAINSKTKMVLLQRSRGYEWRASFTIDEIEKAIGFIKGIRSDVLVLVDNATRVLKSLSLLRLGRLAEFAYQKPWGIAPQVGMLWEDVMCERRL